MKLHDPTKPYVIEVLYTFHFEPKDGVVWKHWDALTDRIWEMSVRKRYRGVEVVETEATPASYPHFTFTATDRRALERFLDRAFVLARQQHVRIHR